MCRLILMSIFNHVSLRDSSFEFTSGPFEVAPYIKQVQSGDVAQCLKTLHATIVCRLREREKNISNRFET